MKIALIVPGFSAHEKDWCIPALLDHVRVLATQAEVHVFTLRWPEHGRTYTVFGATVHPLDGREHLGWRAFGLWARAWQAIIEEHRREPFTALHAFWADEPGWVAAWAGRRLGIPVIISLAGGELVGLQDIGYGAQLLPGRRALIRWSLRQATWVTTGSKYLLNIARAHLPQRQWLKLVSAPLGVDTALFSPLSSQSRPAMRERPGMRVLNVGSLTLVKDQAMLLRAVRRLSEVHLQIVGDGPLKNELERLTAKLGITERVEFPGEIDHGEMPAMYRAADLFVQSSRHEAQGMAVLEAAACGISVVGTAVGVLPELGQAAPVGDEAALAAAIRQSLESGDRGGREKVEKRFSLEAAVERCVQLYLKPSNDKRQALSFLV